MENICSIIVSLTRQADLPDPTFVGWDHTALYSIEACESAAQYFSRAIPSSTVDLEILRILGPEDLLQENTELIPGCFASPLGFITFATTSSGDSFSIDLLTGLVYLLEHDKFENKMISPGWKPDFSGFYDLMPVTRDNIIATSNFSWPDIQTALSSVRFYDEED